jgi:hypothetical protein
MIPQPIGAAGFEPTPPTTPKWVNKSLKTLSEECFRDSQLNCGQPVDKTLSVTWSVLQLGLEP